VHPLEMLKRSTPDQCREIGEIFLSFVDRPRDDEFRAMIDTVLAKFADPGDADRAAAINAGRARVEALNTGLLADGMNHQKLIADELSRRGDGRSVDDYCRSVMAGDRLAHSDVIHGDIARD